MKFQNVSGVQNFSIYDSLDRKLMIQKISSYLELWGYQYVEIPSIISTSLIAKAIEGTENKIFSLSPSFCLIPEVTKYIVSMGAQRLRSNKIYYVAKCFRNENTTDSERLREFTQIGVEYLLPNNLDAKKEVRRDALRIFSILFEGASPEAEWKLEDACQRGLNLYSDEKNTFEINSPNINKQLLGGGAYEGGAGWAIGLERLMKCLG